MLAGTETAGAEAGSGGSVFGLRSKSKGPLGQTINDNEDQKDDLQEDQRTKGRIRRRVRAQGKEEKHAMLPSLHVLEET